MTNQSSIQYITTLLDSPDTLTEGDQSSIALFRQTFPYFVPVRYLAALEVHKKTEFAPEMLSAIKPYMGNWMLFCDFLDAGANARPLPMSKPVVAEPEEVVEPAVAEEEQVIEEPIIKVVDKKSVELKADDEPVQPATTAYTPNNKNRDRRDNNRRDNRAQRRNNSPATPNPPILDSDQLEFADAEEVASSAVHNAVEAAPEQESIQETIIDNMPKPVSAFDADEVKLAAEEANDAKEWVMESTVQVLTPLHEPSAAPEVTASWLDRVNNDLDLGSTQTLVDPITTERIVAAKAAVIAPQVVEPVNEPTPNRDESILHELTAPLPDNSIFATPLAAPPVDETPAPHIALEPAPLAAYKVVVDEPAAAPPVVEPQPHFTPEELPVPIAPYKVQIAPDELPSAIVGEERHAVEPVAIIPQKVVYEPLPELLPYSAAAQTTPYNVIVSAHDPEPTPDDNINAWQNVAFGPGILMMELDSRKSAAEPVATPADIPPVSAEPVPAPQAETLPVYEAPLAEAPAQEAAIPVAPESDAMPTNQPVEETNVEPTADAQAPASGSVAEEQLIYPIYTEDYFLHQGIPASADIPDEIAELMPDNMTDEEKSLMVMMSFTEWLLHFKKTAQKQKEEKKDQKALKTMWQKEKLAAAIEEENEEIPENVFEMAVNSITKEDGLASESLADIYIKQGKYDKAIEMYRKLSLRNPKKNVYFARKIEEILKEKQS